jgi:putative ABC transport system substrate-binding protein
MHSARSIEVQPDRPGMDRRRFLLTSLAGAMAVPLAAEAQPAGKAYRIGVLTLVSAPSYEEVFRQSLKERGYIEGQNLILDIARANGKAELLPELAQGLLDRRVDLIVTVSNDATAAAKRATTTVPIVMAAVGDPERRGLVASLSRPGGNVTGLTLDPGSEIVGKMMELLRQAAPKVSRVAFVTSADSGLPIWTQHAATAAKTLGIEVRRFLISDPQRISEVLDDITREKQDALLLSTSALVFSVRRLILDFAMTNRMPGVYPFRPYANDGGLLTYGVDLTDLFRRSVIYVDKILKGIKPGDLPVEQPTKFELVINLKTAKALGLTIPPSLLARADQVIE